MSKTTYILCGGNDAGMTGAQNLKLRKTILARLNGEKPRIASVLFAKLREDWEINFRDKRTPVFDRLFDKNYEAHLVFPDTFREEAKWANVIYLHGGDPVLLKYYLDKFDDIREIFASKIVIGSSAGTCYLSKLGYEIDWRKIMPWSGLVDIAQIVHFKSSFGDDDPRGKLNWDKMAKELREATDLPIYLIREGDFVEIGED